MEEEKERRNRAHHHTKGYLAERKQRLDTFQMYEPKDYDLEGNPDSKRTKNAIKQFEQTIEGIAYDTQRKVIDAKLQELYRNKDRIMSSMDLANYDEIIIPGGDILDVEGNIVERIPPTKKIIPKSDVPIILKNVPKYELSPDTRINLWEEAKKKIKWLAEESPYALSIKKKEKEKERKIEEKKRIKEEWEKAKRIEEEDRERKRRIEEWEKKRKMKKEE